MPRRCRHARELPGTTGGGGLDSPAKPENEALCAVMPAQAGIHDVGFESSFQHGIALEAQNDKTL